MSWETLWEVKGSVAGWMELDVTLDGAGCHYRGMGDVEWVRGLCSRLGGLVRDEVSEGGCGTQLEVGGTMEVWRLHSRLGGGTL